MKRLKLRSLLLTTFIVNVGCAGIPKITPHVVDTQLQECREYKVVDYENLIIKYVVSHPIEKCNGYYALSQREAAELKAWYLKNKTKKH